MICISSLQKLPAFDPVYPFFHFLYSSVLELSHALNLQQYTIWQDTGKYDSSKISFHDNQYVRICSCLTQKQEFPICYQRCIKLMTTYWSKQWATACQAVKLQCDVLNVTLITLAVFTLHCVLCLLAMGSCQWNVVRTVLGRWSQVRSITVLFLFFSHWAHVIYEFMCGLLALFMWFNSLDLKTHWASQAVYGLTRDMSNGPWLDVYILRKCVKRNT